ncbi:MarR family transcriptional regulator [Candidatus Pacearchaeota archaeon]|nr:MAG: MarR family transcriptional regulator [Candidatus Pacearchaeota archaeon]
MDFDLFLTEPRWRVLEIIANCPSSPAEIAAQLNTSLAYVSQQLRLLEAANLVTKQRTKSVEKGRARVVYSLTQENAYIGSLIKGFAFKKKIKLSNYHKAILKIWSLENPQTHEPASRAYNSLLPHLKEIEAIFLVPNSAHAKPSIAVVSSSRKLKPLVESIERELKPLSSELVSIKLLTKEEFAKRFSLAKLIPLHDPNCLLGELKGGELKSER